MRHQQECSACPEGTYFSNGTWDLDAITFGHFRRAKSEDALASGTGCEGHVNGFGGAILLTKEERDWKKIWYARGERARYCKKLTAFEGRDLLLCEIFEMHQGVAETGMVLIDPGHDPKGETESAKWFFSVIDTLGACAQSEDGTTSTGDIEPVRYLPGSRPHRGRIIVDTQLGAAAIPNKGFDACATGRVPTIAKKPRRYEFLFDGKTITRARGNPLGDGDSIEADAPMTSFRLPR